MNTTDLCPNTGRTYHLHKNAPPTPCPPPCGYTHTYKPPKAIGPAEMHRRRVRDRMEMLADVIVPIMLGMAGHR